NFGNVNTLAQAYMPPPINNFSIAGDLDFNTAAAYGKTYDLFTVAVHEIGHALGLGHSDQMSAEMYSSYDGSKGSAAGDDMAGIQAIYGRARSPDRFEGVGGNGAFSSATDITSSVNSSSLTAVVNNVDITAYNDADYYTFTAPSRASGN